MRRISLEAGRAGWADFLPVDDLADIALSAGEWERIAGEDGASPVIAERGEEPVGFAVVRPSQDDDSDEKTGELYALYVLPSSWGTGVTRGLMGAALDRMRESGFAEATLWAAELNRRARAAYESTGWRRDGTHRRRKHLGVDFDEPRYRIDLGRAPPA
jgi:GNAT superfamily N-acetyltransferase